MSGNPVVVQLEGTSILDKIQEKFGIATNDILQAIAIKSVGFKHIESLDLDGKASGSPNLLSNNIKPKLPNSRILVMFQLSFSGTEPDIKWKKIKGAKEKSGTVLSTLSGTKVSGSDYQFDEPMTRGTEYNMIVTQDCTFDYLLMIEYAIGL